MKQEIRDALLRLDPEDDSHWTSKGLPQTTVVANLSGVLTLTRGELNDIAQGYDREAARRRVAHTSKTGEHVSFPTDTPPAQSSQPPQPGPVAEAIEEPAAAEAPDHVANMIAIREWIDSEASKREQRAERQVELLEMGIESHELPTRRSPIDLAMARSLGYGHARPEYPAPTKGVAGLVGVARRNDR